MLLFILCACVTNSIIFDGTAGGGALVCSDNYEGPAPGSSAEAKAVGDFLLATPSITTYLSVHSFGPVSGAGD